MCVCVHIYIYIHLCMYTCINMRICIFLLFANSPSLHCCSEPVVALNLHAITRGVCVSSASFSAAVIFVGCRTCPTSATLLDLTCLQKEVLSHAWLVISLRHSSWKVSGRQTGPSALRLADRSFQGGEPMQIAPVSQHRTCMEHHFTVPWLWPPVASRVRQQSRPAARSSGADAEPAGRETSPAQQQVRDLDSLLFEWHACGVPSPFWTTLSFSAQTEELRVRAKSPP